jgi:hypothetical protein
LRSFAGHHPLVRKQYNFWPWPTDDGRTAAWDVDRLIELSRDLPVNDIEVASVWQLDSPHWGQVTPRDLALHIRLVEEADLAYPIILSADGRVMDGMHRVVKALIQGRSKIPAVQFEMQPEPDFLDCRPSDLPYPLDE